MLIGLVTALLAALVGRLCWLTVEPHPVIHKRSATQHRLRLPLLPRRGLIVDCTGRILACSIECRSVFADPQLLADEGADPAAVAARVAPAIGRPIAEVGKQLAAPDGRRFTWLKRWANRADADVVAAMEIRGIGLLREAERTYPMGKLAAHVLGFVGADGHGLEGLERTHDKLLSGREGVKISVSDAARRAIWVSREDFRPPVDGTHLVLTLDSAIQATAEAALAESCGKYEAESGTALVMDPCTGEVLAWANWPTFAPGRLRESRPDSRRNRLATDPFEPGSIFKPLVAAAALEAGVCQSNQMFNCDKAVFSMGGTKTRRLREYTGRTYGQLSFRDVIVKSSNVGMGQIGVAMGNKRLYDSLRGLGFGQRTGIGVSGEDPGLFWPLSKWTAYSTTSLPMGQEVSVTSLQMLRAFAALANGGLLLEPRIVRGLVDPHGTMVWDNSRPIVVRRVFREEVAREMMSILSDVVKRGTGTRAALEGYQAFGKTGTAQIANRGGGGYEEGAYVSSFIGGAPAGEPQIVAVVSVYRPVKRKGYAGGVVAAPAVKKILEHALRYLRVPREAAPAGTQLVSG